MAVVGIDLGTTNTVIAAVRDGRATALKDKLGRALLPSVVSFTPKGASKVGYEAKDRRTIDPENTIFSIKRLIGRTFDSEHVQKARTRLPFELKEGPGKSTLVSSYGRDYTLPEISAMVLEQAQKIGEARLGSEVSDAVITVPANFNDLQRAATKVAGRTAGLEVLRIINEPTAAALAYGFGKTGRERIAVYDFGGGTFDVTLLDLSENVFEVLATAGDTFLGGDDIDRAIMDQMAEELLKKNKVDASQDNLVREQLRVSAETLKIELSTRSMAKVRIEELEFDFTMRRSEFEKLTEPFLARTLEVCKEAMDIAGVANRDLDQILMVGGSTRIPLVRRRISSFFGKMPQSRINPDEVVAIGAAIQASSLEAKQAGGASIPVAPRPRAASPGPSGHPSRGPAPLGAAPQGTTRMGLAGLKKTLAGQGEVTQSASPGGRTTGLGLGGMASVPPDITHGPGGTKADELKPGTPGKKRGPARTLAGVGPGDAELAEPLPTAGVPHRKVHKTLAGVGVDSSSNVPRGPMKTLSGVGSEVESRPRRPGGLSSLSDRPKGNTNLGLGAHPSSPPPVVGKPPPSTHEESLVDDGPSPSDFDEITSVNEGALRVAAELEKRARKDGPAPPVQFPPTPPEEEEVTDGSVTFDLAELEGMGSDDDLEVSADDDFATLSDETTQIVDPKKVEAQAVFLDRRAAPLAPDAEPEELGDSALIGFEEVDLPSPAADLPSPIARPSQPEELGDSGLMTLSEDDFDDTSGVDLPSPAAALPSPVLPLGKTEVGLPSPLRGLRANREQHEVDLPTALGRPPSSFDDIDEEPALPLVGQNQRMPGPDPARHGLGSTQVATSGPDFGAARGRAPSVDDLDELSVASLLPEDDSSADLDLADAELNIGPGVISPLQATQAIGSRLSNTNASHGERSAQPAAWEQNQRPSVSPLGATIVGQGSPLARKAPLPEERLPEERPPESSQQQTYSGRSENRPMAGGGPLLLDVTPLSLGVEVTGGYVDTLIQRNSPIPCEMTRTFATAQDNQAMVRVRVSQGEAERFDRNTLLGEVELTGLSRGPRGSVRIDVSFSLDESGMLQVSARDRATGNAANARLMLVGVDPSS